MTEQPTGLFDKINELMAKDPTLTWDDAAKQISAADKQRQAGDWGSVAEGTEGGAKTLEEQKLKDRTNLNLKTPVSFKGGTMSRLSDRIAQAGGTKK